MRKLVRLLPLLILMGVIAVSSAGCMDASNSEVQRENAVKQRANVYDKAQRQVPTPSVNNFPRRKTLADAVVRQSEPNHPWYVYVLGQNGNVVNYFVAKSVPVNDCDYLSSTENIVNPGDNGNTLIGAPSLEGIYQSGSGCNTLTFFDLTTDAEIQITSLQSFVTDRPLKVDAAPIKVRGSK
jgi:hypothetical protein